MCNYCGYGMYPYGGSSYQQFYGYPANYQSYPNYPSYANYGSYPSYANYGSYPGYAGYGLASGYAYAPSFASMAPPVYFSSAPAVSRGEYKVGNCLMICQ